MSTDRWEQLERIFAAARELPREAWAAFVERESGPDEGLRREALGLLAAEDASGRFMAEPAFNRLAEAVAGEGWSLRPGERIGAYTVLRLLGSGGAGEVWRARDERLGRDVAIKVLLPHFSSDADRLRRFMDEARTAGALNHSNILTVYDVGEHQGTPFLVSECLEGQSLRQRVESGRIPLEEAVALTLGIARGLAAAHARGIVHRDLKPENTFIRSDGVVKILDFGLAKLQSALEGLPTDARHTMTGVIVGTAGYMAPEQIRGEQVDARADLFALGVMLYEMLGGRHPFRGASTFETLHAVLTLEPPKLPAEGQTVPQAISAIVMRLLKKVPDARFQSALDLIWAIEQAAGAPVALEPAAAPAVGAERWWRSRWFPWVAAPVSTALALTGVWLLLPERTAGPDPPGPTYFTWTLPPEMVLQSSPAISPDSRQIAFAGKDAKTTRLYVRDLGSTDAVAIAGTEDARLPFWSPDGRWLGFFAGGQLMKTAWPGGAPVALTRAPFALGGAWSASNVLLFGPDVILSGLYRIPAEGGDSEPATLLDLSRGDNSHCWPVFLPDGVHVLYFVRSTDDARRGVYLRRVDQPPSDPGSLLFKSDSQAAYAPLPGTTEGLVVYVANGRIEARRFDAARLTVAADARSLGLSAAGTTLAHPMMLSVSRDVLAFVEGVLPYGNRLEAVARTGERIRLWDEPEAQNWPRVSPDGRRLARQRVHPLHNNPDIWVEDLDRGTEVRVTMALEPDISPVWAPDGRHLAYVSGNLPGRPGERILNVSAADGTGVIRTFPCPGTYCEPTDWFDDRLLVNVVDSRGGRDVWTVSTESGAARPLLAESFNERDARFAPERPWVAYVSNESGRPEVSVRTVSGPPQRVAVSSGGGDQPVWRRDGLELFFVDLQGRLQTASVDWQRDGTPLPGRAAPARVPPIGFGHWGTQYDLSPDGNRIYFMRRNDDEPPREIHVVLGWRALLD